MKKDLINFFTSPEIKKKIDSEQFDLSNILINRRVELELSFPEIAEIAGFTNNEYIKLEYGDIDVPVKDYESAINKIDEWDSKRKGSVIDEQ